MTSAIGFSRYIIAWNLCTTMKAEDVTALISRCRDVPHNLRLPVRRDRAVSRESRQNAFVTEVLAPNLEFLRRKLTSFVPLVAPDHHLDLAPQPGVVTSKDMEPAQVEKAWYGHWRRVNRRR